MLNEVFMRFHDFELFYDSLSDAQRKHIFAMIFTAFDILANVIILSTRSLQNEKNN